MSDDEHLTFGHYVVTSRAGEGALGVVYRARHVELGRDAAVKVLRPEVRANAAALAGLTAEASTLSRLDHPNIVALYDFVQEPEHTWLAEQWVEGAPLDAVLRAHGQLTPEQALGAAAGALAGLAHAHDHDVVHRDVAASNVLADMAGTSMLVDFGLAAPLEGRAGSTGSAGVVGTPAYLSPEAARQEPVGKPGDVYSAAALTYHLLTGSPVFPGTAWEMVTAHRDRPAPQLVGHGPRLAALVERALDKDPAARPPDAGAFLAELEEAAAERYGADWRSRASIAGLVAATLGVGAATAVGAAGAGAPATVVAESLPPVVTGVTQAAVSTGRRAGLKTIAAAGVSAAVVVTGVLVVLRLAGDDGGSAGSGSGRPSADLTLSVQEERDRAREQRQEQIEELTAGAPTGRYRGVRRVTGITYLNGGGKKPPGDTFTWTLSAPRCTATSCRGVIRSSGAAKGLEFTWDGRMITVARPPETVRRAPCYDAVTGQKRPLSEAAWAGTYSYDYQPAAAPAGPDGRPPVKFVIRSRGTFSKYRLFGNCDWSDDTWLTFTVTDTFTRIGR